MCNGFFTLAYTLFNIKLFLQIPINFPKFNGFIIPLFVELEKKKRVIKTGIFQKFYISSKI